MTRARYSSSTQWSGEAAALVRRSADAAMLVDENGMIQCWNRAAQQLLGYHSRDVLGRPCHEVLHGEGPDGQLLCSPSCSIGRRLACGLGVRNFTMHSSTRDGTLIWLNISSLPIKSGRNVRKFMALHLFRDISSEPQSPPLPSVDQQLSAKRGASVPRPAFMDMETPVGPLLHSRSLPLTRRELEILHRLAQGDETSAIAESLCISRHTVRNHVQHILAKLGVHSRLQALAAAYRPRA